ncbi:hypothetical protein [Arthrobacter sp. KNU40]|uniref:hypothetical protein n=1 Tax=Arthrobacter sp. KNU40 TaxID=3447965 RepID=UPI003F5DF271
MASDFEDDDHTQFFRLEGTGSEDKDDHVLSRAAFQLHSFGMINSVRDGNPGFISDDYLNAIAAETTLTAADLVGAGLWKRSSDGYLVTDPQMLEMVLDASERNKDDFQYEPDGCPGHVRGPNSGTRCRRCGIELDEDDQPAE